MLLEKNSFLHQETIFYREEWNVKFFWESIVFFQKHFKGKKENKPIQNRVIWDMPQGSLACIPMTCLEHEKSDICTLLVLYTLIAPLLATASIQKYFLLWPLFESGLYSKNIFWKVLIL